MGSHAVLEPVATGQVGQVAVGQVGLVGLVAAESTGPS